MSRPPRPCRCRICVAKSLARAMRQIDRGRTLVAADIVMGSVVDLTEDAVFVSTGSGTAVPLCEKGFQKRFGP